MVQGELRDEYWRLWKSEEASLRKNAKFRLQKWFFNDPFGLSKSFFEQRRSGTLEVDKAQLEDHLHKTYAEGK